MAHSTKKTAIAVDKCNKDLKDLAALVCDHLRIMRNFKEQIEHLTMRLAALEVQQGMAASQSTITISASTGDGVEVAGHVSPPAGDRNVNDSEADKEL